MNKLLSSMLIALAFISLPSATLSQTISYAYDSSGNRIKREIRMNVNKMPGRSGVEDTHAQERISDRNLKIYTNTIGGKLKIEIIGYDPTDEVQMQLFSISGYHIHSDGIYTSSIEVDMSSYQKGVYVLLILINGKSTSWKIILE